MRIEDHILKGEAATHEEILRARERRAAEQRRLLGAHGGALISFTMNMPGAYKSYPLAQEGFQEGVRSIRAVLRMANIPVLHAVEHMDRAGYECFLNVGAPAAEVKRRMMEIEDTHPLGRLYDIDVLDCAAGILAGRDFGREARRCLLCEEAAWSCAKSGAHTLEELALCAADMLRGYTYRAYAEAVAARAVRALVCEVDITPKPGLVDRANTGAHRDMDRQTFLRSAEALEPYFRDVVEAGLACGDNMEALLGELRPRGMRAEEEMRKATGGVNTHKGAIFSFGLLCAALGYLHARAQQETPEAVLGLCARMAARTPEELKESGPQALTNGERMYAAYGLKGVRREAAAGFPHVREYGYVALKKWTAAGHTLNDAGVAALLQLMARVEDTNVAARGGIEALRNLQAETASFLETEPCMEDMLAYAEATDARLIAQNISPGGSADLLAVSLFLYFSEYPAGPPII